MAKKSLLLVDADSKSLRMLEVSLRKAGFSVTTALHAADAHDKLGHGAPDLLIVDTKLPGDESGFDFVGRLKQAPETASIPIIFLSSENKLQQKVAGLELGVDDYLTKPIYIKEVLTRVRVLLDKREKQTLERRERNASFSGLLGDMGLVDLMQTVELGRRTGRIVVESRGQTCQVSFREGKVCDARIGRLTGERAFYRMLVWNDGVFSMDFGPHDDADVIELSTQGLLMEGMRRVDEWGRLLEQLPPLEHRFEVDYAELVERLAEVPDEVNAILRLFDGRRTLLEVVDETDFGDLEALEIASKLYFEGLIVDVDVREPDDMSGTDNRVEAWLKEPAPPHGVHDDDHGGLLVPNDTIPPMAAEALPVPPTSGFFLMPPSGDADTVVANALASDPALPHGAARVDDVVESMFADAIPTIPGRPSTHRPSVAPTIISPAPEVTGPPTTAIPTPAPVPPVEQARPLPACGDEAPESRSVLPRSAVGAQVWSSRAVHGGVDADQSQGIGAHEPHATTVEAHASLADVATQPMASGASPTSATAAAAPTPAAAGTPRPARETLADDLGLSEDELALALTAGDVTRAAPPSATPQPSAGPVGEDLADLIAAQIEDGGEARVPIGGQHGEAPATGRSAVVAVVAAVDAPNPAAPAAAVHPARRSGEDDEGDEGDEGDDGDEHEDDESIHQRRTAVDREPLPPIDRFGISWPVAVGLFLVGFILFVVVVRSCTGAEAGHAALAAAVDAGAEAEATPPPVEAPPQLWPTAEPVPSPEATTPPSSATDPVAIAEPTPAPPAVPAPLTEPPPPLPVPEPTPASTSTPPPEPAAEPTPTTEVEDDATRYVRQLKAADALAAKGRHGRSVKAYKAALAVNPDGVAAHLGLGNAYYELDSLDAALVHLEKARKLAPDDPQVYVLLGTAYQSANRTAEAVAAYERYLVLAPDGRFARDVRGILKGLRR